MPVELTFTSQGENIVLAATEDSQPRELIRLWVSNTPILTLEAKAL